MKTYPYQDGDRLIQLVEKRELDQLLERLAEARESHLAASARDVQTIQRQAIMLKRLARALKEIAWIKETGQRDYSLTGDIAFAALTAYEASKLEPVANPIDEAVKRMEAVPVKELRDEYMETLDDELHSFEDRDKPFTTIDLVNTALEAVRTSLIQAAKGEQL